LEVLEIYTYVAAFFLKLAGFRQKDKIKNLKLESEVILEDFNRRK
jgi:hypothetical protein